MKNSTKEDKVFSKKDVAFFEKVIAQIRKEKQIVLPTDIVEKLGLLGAIYIASQCKELYRR